MQCGKNNDRVVPWWCLLDSLPVYHHSLQIIEVQMGDKHLPLAKKRDARRGYVHFHGSHCEAWVTSDFCSVLASTGFCNKIPPTEWLNAPQISYLTVLEVTSLKQVRGAAYLLEALWDSLFLYLFHLLEAAQFPWPTVPLSIFKSNSEASSLLSELCFHPYIFLSPSPPPHLHLHGPLWSYWARLNNPGLSPHVKILNFTSAKPLLPC